MNKREISEIKKQFKKDNNAITRICGCYVDAEKQIKTTLKEAFFRFGMAQGQLNFFSGGYFRFDFSVFYAAEFGQKIPR